MEKEYAPHEVERVLPDSCIEVIYQRDEPYSQGGEPLPKWLMVNHLDKPLELKATRIKQWCVRFLPWGLAPFGEVRKLKNPLANARSVLRMNLDVLESRLQTVDNNTFASVFDDFLLQQFLAWRFEDELIQQAATHIRTEKGNVKVSELAEYCFRSTRQLEREFLKNTGRAPSEIIARVRFEHVRQTLTVYPDTPVTELAVSSGYADQSHLIKEFKRFTDMTPGAFVQAVKAMGIHNDPDVAFLQSDL